MFWNTKLWPWHDDFHWPTRYNMQKLKKIACLEKYKYTESNKKQIITRGSYPFLSTQFFSYFITVLHILICREKKLNTVWGILLENLYVKSGMCFFLEYIFNNFPLEDVL